MEKVKIDIKGLFNNLFGTTKKEESIEKELEEINKISSGIEWEEFHGSSKEETKSKKFGEYVKERNAKQKTPVKEDKNKDELER